jgi:3-oxoacyl-[acyl-carrier-protein] synthase I
MKTIWAVADSIVSPLGVTSAENFSNVVSGRTGVKATSFNGISDRVMAGAIDVESNYDGSSKFDTLCRRAIESLLSNVDLNRSETVLILSSTKGNIELIEEPFFDRRKVALHSSASSLARHFGFARHLVVSNACISGVLALITAKRLLQADACTHVVVVGADVLSTFIVSGFQSLQALSSDVCKPFDIDRKGINLGEGAGAVLLTLRPELFECPMPILLAGEGVSNDANHISGPSRTGDELAQAINAALATASVRPEDVDFVSAHGTATLYNDEMESKAFATAGLSNIPLNSLKGYYGHTLGAAGVVESIIAMHALRDDRQIGTLGHSTSGVSGKINICTTTEKRRMKRILKTASGFGGCNAALVLEKK